MSETLDAFLSNSSRDWSTITLLNRWEICRDEEIITFIFYASDGEQYIVRIICDNYPTLPPSVFFINGKGEKNDICAWPRGQGIFFDYVKPPMNSFICAPLTFEGVQHHPEWKGIWNPSVTTLMDALNFLHALLNDAKYGYQGRHQ